MSEPSRARTALGRGPGADSPWALDPSLSAALEASPALVAVCLGPDLTLAYQNRAARETFGELGLGKPLAEAFVDTAPHVEELRRVVETGQTMEFSPRRVGSPDVHGNEVVLRYVVAPYGPPGEPVAGIVITAVDMTAEARAEEQAARSQLLADLTSRLIDAPDAVAGLQSLADMLTETIADIAAILISSPEGSDPDAPPVPPTVVSISAALHAVGTPPPATERADFTPWRDAVLAGEAIIAPVTAETIPLIAADERREAWLRESRSTSLAVVPLIVAGTLNGALVLGTAGDRPRYVREDLPFLTDAAARLGAAIAQLHSQLRQRDVALRLQRALLPARLPAMPRLACAARYLPGSFEIEVGGDWWDMHDLGDGQVSLGIGDVAGRGLSAAVVMGQARAAMHAASYMHLAPTQVLRMLDQHLNEITASGRLDGDAPPRFATACYGILDLDQHALRIANAGHLPFLVRRRDGRVETVTVRPAPPLGLRLGGFTELEVAVEPGDTVALFTDGLVESRAQPLDSGIAQLSRVLGEIGAGDDLEQIADDLIEAMGREPGEGADDTTLLVVRVLD